MQYTITHVVCDSTKTIHTQLKTPLFLPPNNDPRTELALNFRAIAYRCSSILPAWLFVRLLQAPSSGLPPEKAHTSSFCGLGRRPTWSWYDLLYHLFTEEVADGLFDFHIRRGWINIYYFDNFFRTFHWKVYRMIEIVNKFFHNFYLFQKLLIIKETKTYLPGCTTRKVIVLNNKVAVAYVISWVQLTIFTVYSDVFNPAMHF